MTSRRGMVEALGDMGKTHELKVGAFMLAGAAILGGVVFMIGQERQLFSSKVEYRTVFEDVEGLKRGSPVRMGGVDIGIVSDVGYSKDANDARLYVSLEIVESEARRIRLDSTASIAGKGLLGDKMINLAPGTVGKPRIEPGGVIPSQESQDLTRAIAQLGNITLKVDRVLNNLENTTGALADEKLHSDIKSSMASIESILGGLARSEGYVGRLLSDEKEAAQLSTTIRSLQHTSDELGMAVASLNQTMTRVNDGPGFAHDLIYGEGPTRTVNSFGDAADELARTLKGVREGNGLARSIIYGDEGSQKLSQNLEEISSDVRAIVADVKAGKGTLGALLVDPSVYEDIKVLLGNVSRNKALRALVRYSIEQDEAVSPVQVSDPEASSPTKSGEK